MGVIDWSALSLDELLDREWIATNGLGGFASSTIPSLNTRKYHGLLVAALSPPARPMVLLSRVEESVTKAGQSFPLASAEYPGVIFPAGHQYLRAFSPEPFPRWAYQADGWTIEKQLRLLPGENTVLLSYTLLGGKEGVEFEVRPLFALRGVHDLAYQWNGRLIVETNAPKGQPFTEHRIPPTNRSPEVFFAHDGRFGSSTHWYLNTIYRREQQRGYAGLEDVWTPGVVKWALAPGQTVHFACSTDPIDLPRVIDEGERRERMISTPTGVVAGERTDPRLDALARAADQFVVRDGSIERAGTTRLMAGYPWSPPAGRDAMVSFTGLLLVTGRLAEARSLLAFYAEMARAGLVPSEFPSDGSAPRYESADASLWFVNAAWQYLRYGGDAAFVTGDLLPVIESILQHYREGTTALGIAADADGLLVCRQPGVPLTWMDAKVGEWVITPRGGRPVEVNALWYNAQRIAAALNRAAGQVARADQRLAEAEATRAAFNRRFWNVDARCCYDVVDDAASDAALRPNQLLAVSLPFPVLSIDRHADVVEACRRELVTPVGLRTLSPSHPHYTPTYEGEQVSRDRAYHQGCAFPWLLGPYVTALLRVRGRSQPARNEASALLDGCIEYLRGDGLGQLCELFHGDAPHVPGGLPASARSVAELLRCYAEDVLDLAPSASTSADCGGVQVAASEDARVSAKL